MSRRPDPNGLVARLFQARDPAELRALCRTHRDALDEATLAAAEAGFGRSLGSNPQDTARWAETVSAIGRLLSSPRAAICVRRTRGVQAHLEGRHADARRQLDSARRELAAEQDWTGAGDIDRVLIDVSLATGDTRGASRFYRRGVQAYRRVAKLPQQRWGSLEMNRGNLHHAKDDYRGALEAYDKAAQHFRSGGKGSVVRLGNVSFNRANIFALQDRMSEARRAYAQARSAFVKGGRTASVGKVERALAELDRQEGRLDVSLERLDSIRGFRTDQGDRLGLAHVELERGRVLLALNRFDEAHKAVDRAERSFSEAGQKLRIADCDSLLGELEIGRNRIQAGVRKLAGAARSYREQGNALAAARIDSVQAAARIQAESTPAARKAAAKLARAALRVFVRERIVSGKARATALTALAAEAGSARASVRKRAQEALRLARTVGDARTEFEMQMLLGREDERRNEFGLAFRRFSAAELCVERMREGVRSEASKLAFAKDKGQVYERLIRNRLRKGDPTALRQALRYSERGKARALIDALGQLTRSQPTPRNRATARVLEKLEKVERDLHRAERRLEQGKGPKGFRATQPGNLRRLNANRLQMLNQLSGIDAERAMIHGAGPPEPWAYLDRLAADETVLSYTRTGDTFHLFVIDSNGIRAFSDIASVADVRIKLDRLRFQFGKGIYGDEHFHRFGDLYEQIVRGHLRHLQPLLLGPVWQELNGRKVRIVPHEILHGLPFHALECDGETLIDRCEVSYAPSVATLAALTDRKAARSSAPVILGVADRSAPEIDREVSIVERHLPGARKLEGRNATVSAMRELKQQPSLLHVACHASFQQADPWSAGLRLGDAWVRLADLYEMRRTGDVVVLSGCATGRGTVYSGDEWVGLVRGFLRAGARTVLASLWEVHDRSTMQLMEGFYGSFADGQTVPRALAEAQRSARREGVPVLHWAAFMSIGSSLPRLREKEVA